MPKDEIYRTPRKPVAPFQFDWQVASVFDDMIRRSVPCYAEIIDRQVQLIANYYQPGTHIYDLGASTGNLCIGVCRQFCGNAFSMLAVDDSEAMLEMLQRRLDREPNCSGIHLVCQDIRRTRIERASVVVLNFTLQFLPLGDRDDLIRRIFDGLQPGGVLLFCEKIIHADPQMADLQNDFYYSFKRENGYSKLEISQKREALEKVLVPETIETHQDRLQHAGFDAIDTWLKWFNFAAWIAIKKSR